LTFPLYLDEDVNPAVSILLDGDGIDALSAQKAGRANQKIPDEEQLAFAAGQGRAIVTHNVKDYDVLARQWAAQGKPHAGIIMGASREPWELAEDIRRLQASYPVGIRNYCLYLSRA
jgi:predicted nuclease of predicted toxin-antitoxin system